MAYIGLADCHSDRKTPRHPSSRQLKLSLPLYGGMFLFVYLEYIIVFRKPLVDRMKHVRSVLRLLYEAVVTLSLKKCRLFW